MIQTIVIPFAPVAKGRPRMTRQGRAYTPAKTRAAEGKIIEYFLTLGVTPKIGPLDVSLFAIMPIPGSWSKAKQANALAGLISPTGKPDLDNICKLVLDAANGVLWTDDSQIVRLDLCKAYGGKPGYILSVGEYKADE
jgi:Holliday junction resolvase RusA-like endonuclease